VNTHFTQLEAAFARVIDLAGEERTRALEALFVDRPALRRDLLELLDAHDRVASADTDLEHVPAGVGPDTVLGVYRIIDRIGEGGMGEIFRAERSDGLFAQQVAIKVTRSFLASSTLVRRFQVERQILASLSHPNIVTLVDGGATTAGQAYLVMEHVEGGAPLTDYVRARALPLAERLRLFTAVCDAVQYAHRHAVVHRDLKPDNVLVGADRVPKVVDFGIAKLLDQPASTGATTKGVLPGPLTPNYASPEQLRGLPVTTAADVYALGVILYELVCGVRPYETQDLTLDRVLDLVLHATPPRPSEARPELPPPYPLARLRGDLDAIVGKAMSKEPADRYSSARELAEDITRFLNGDPVVARAPSTAYLLRRLAARNKVAVGVMVLVTAAILSVGAIATWQRQVALDAQGHAERRFHEVRQLANTLIFKIHDAVVPLPGSTPVRRTIVDEGLRYLERLEREAADDVALRVELAAGYRQIGSILGNPTVANLGDRTGATAQYERARAILVPLATAVAPFEVIAALVDADIALSPLYHEKDVPRATAILREAVDVATRYQQRHPAELRATNLLARVNFRLAQTLPPAEAVPVWHRTLADYESLLAADPESDQNQRNVALVGKYLGGIFEVDRDYEAARAHYARALELDGKRLLKAPDDQRVQFDAAISFANVASVSEALGDLEAAAGLFDRSLTLRRQLAAADPTNMQTMGRLGFLLGRLARFYNVRDNARARTIGREAVDVLQHVDKVSRNASSRRELAYALGELAKTEQQAGDRMAACRAFRGSDAAYTDSGLNPEGRHTSMRAFVAEQSAACAAE
jgi:serine/threonine protein kinase/tetratricopeptide (TPR) repeat protein